MEFLYSSEIPNGVHLEFRWSPGGVHADVWVSVTSSSVGITNYDDVEVLSCGFFRKEI